MRDMEPTGMPIGRSGQQRGRKPVPAMPEKLSLQAFLSPSQRLLPHALPGHLSLPWLHSRVTAKTEFALSAYAYAAEWWQVSQKCSTSQTLSAPIPERMDVRRSSAERMENVRTSTKTRLTWSLTILLALAAIATSVTYVVSKHLAQAQDATHRLRQVA